MIYIRSYKGIERARCKHCSKSWFELLNSSASKDRSAYFGQCVRPGCDKVVCVTRTQLACDHFVPRSSFRLVGKDFDQLSLF